MVEDSSFPSVIYLSCLLTDTIFPDATIPAAVLTSRFARPAAALENTS